MLLVLIICKHMREMHQSIHFYHRYLNNISISKFSPLLKYETWFMALLYLNIIYAWDKKTDNCLDPHFN